MRTVISRVFAAMAILTCVSCSQRDNIYPVSGVVTYNGSPASGAVIFFHRQGGDSTNEAPVMGVVQNDGSFEVMCGASGKGAPPGEYIVLIEWKKESGLRQRHSADVLKGRYADPNNPLLHVTVEERANNLPPFELSDAPQNPRR